MDQGSERTFLANSTSRGSSRVPSAESVEPREPREPREPSGLEGATAQATHSEKRELLDGLLSVPEAMILCLYPLALLLGQIVCIVNPSPSYFSNKRNIFNVLFVKQGWLWTTIVYVLHAVHTIRTFGANNKLGGPVKYVIRYSAAMIWWLFFTQWLFGLPIMDRVFVITGGTCEGVDVENLGTVTSALCRARGGVWIGGHDPSGHTFLMVHSSLMLWFELLPTIKFDSSTPLPLMNKISLAVLALWWWMLLMTAIYFHSFFEKLGGLVWGYIEVLVVYVLARRVTALGRFFGTLD